MPRTHGAFILARYSTNNQQEDSIDVQVQNCRAWCNAHGIPVLDVFADAAVSGMQRSRRQLTRMMESLREGKADTVIVYDQSRAFRRMTSYFAFREELDTMGVRLVSVTQPQIGGDLRDPAVFLSESVTAAFSQMWALQTRQKVISKMRYLAERGEHTGGPPPLGYLVRDGKLEIREDEAEIVRFIFNRYAAGATYGQLLRDLQSSGYMTRAGKPFGKNSLHDILQNRKYIGIYSYGRVVTRPDGTRNNHADPDAGMIEIPDAVPVIVDPEIFTEVQRRMNSRKRDPGGRPPTARNYPLHGKVFCGLCRSTLQSVCSTSHRGRGKYYYYACSNRKSKQSCDLPHIGVNDLEERVAAAVRQILGNPAELEDLLTLLRKCRSSVVSGSSAEIQQLQARREQLERKIRNGSAAVLENPDLRELASQLRELETELDDLDARINVLYQSGFGAAMSEEETRALLERVIQTADHDRDVLLSIVARVEVYPDRILVWTILDTSPGAREEDAMEIRDIPLDSFSDDSPECCNKESEIPASTTALSQQIITSAGNLVFLLPWIKPQTRK